MKKLLLILLIVCAVAAVALGIFIATFDADRYRPLVVSELEQALGKPVQLERLSLDWRGGLALQARGLTIAEGADAAAEPVLQLEAASALIRLGPLLRKEVQVASVVLQRPRIHVSRDAQGQLNITGLAAAGAPTAAARSPSSGPSPVTFNIASFQIEDGTLHWTDAMTSPPTDVLLKALDLTVTDIAAGRPMDLTLQAALAPAEKPNLHLSGRVTPPGPGTPGSFERVKGSIDHVSLERLLPSAPAGNPHLLGLLTLTAEGAAPSLEPSSLARVIAGSGRVKLDSPKIADLNLLREVFNRLSVLPGLVERLQARLPAEYQEKLSASDTILDPIDLSMQLANGSLQFADLRLRTDTFGFSGSGRAGLDGSLAVQGWLRIDRAFSEALIRSVEELSPLTNQAGELEIPLTLQGSANHVAVLPDLRYIGSKVLVTKAVDLISELLNKNKSGSGSEQPSAPDASPDAGEQLRPREILQQFLHRALEQQAPADSPPQTPQ